MLARPSVSPLHRLLAGILALALPGTLCLVAEDDGIPAALAEGDGDGQGYWDGSLQSGIGLTDGNADTLGIHAGIRATHKDDEDEVLLGLGYTYAEDTGDVTRDALHALGQYNYLLSERFYLGALGDFYRDDIALIDYRASAGPLAGYYLIKNDRTTLAIEIGTGYLWSEIEGIPDDYLYLRFAQRFTHKLTERLSLFQSLSYVPEAEDLNRYHGDLKVGIETQLTERFSFHIYANDHYESDPAAGLDRNDFGIYTGLTVSLGPDSDFEIEGAERSVGAHAGRQGLDEDWGIKLAFGGSTSSGNSDTLAAAAGLAATYLGSHSEFLAGVAIDYGETDGEINQERVHAFGQFNEDLGQSAYLGARGDFTYDAIINLDYRITPTLLLGYRLIESEPLNLAIEAGPSYTWEDHAGIADDYLGAYVGERFSWKPNERFEVWQTLGVNLDVNDTENTIVDAKVGLDITLNRYLSLRSAIHNIYDGQPAPGDKRNDFRLTSGLVLNF